MRVVILTSDWKDHKQGDSVELDNDEASLVVNTGFARMSEETIKEEAALIEKQREAKYKPYDKNKDYTTNRAHLNQRDQAEEDAQILNNEAATRTGHAELHNPLSKEAKEKIDKMPPKPGNPPETSGLSGAQDPNTLTTTRVTQREVSGKPGEQSGLTNLGKDDHRGHQQDKKK